MSMMKFNITERLLALRSLDAVEGNLAAIDIIDQLQKDLSFSEEDHAVLGLHQEGVNIVWNQGANLPAKEVSVGPVALDAILKMFKQLDAMEKLKLADRPLYKRLLKEEEKASAKPKLAAV